MLNTVLCMVFYHSISILVLARALRLRGGAGTQGTTAGGRRERNFRTHDIYFQIRHTNNHPAVSLFAAKVIQCESKAATVRDE